MTRRMVKGFIDEHGNPLIEVEVGGRKETTNVLTLVDSGFDGELCLPIEVAIPLGLELSGIQTIELADGSVKRELVFAGSVRWEGRPRSVRISLTTSEKAIIGRELMLNRKLIIDFRSGEVKIER